LQTGRWRTSFSQFSCNTIVDIRRKNREDFFILIFESDPDKRKIAKKVIVQFIRLGLLLTVILILFATGFDTAATQLDEYLATATATPLPSSTPTPESPEAESLYYMVVFDASERMNASFGGSESKWQAATQSLRQKLRILPPLAHYGLVVARGDQTNNSSDPCSLPKQPVLPFFTTGNTPPDAQLLRPENIISTIDALQPSGSASLGKAVSLAIAELTRLPRGRGKVLIIITGGGDTCLQDEWDTLLDTVAMSFGEIKVYQELIVLADEKISDELKNKIQGKIDTLGIKEDMQVHVPDNSQELDESLDETLAQINEFSRQYEPTAIAVQETHIADETGLPVSTPIPQIPKTSTNTPEITLALSTTPTSTATPSITPTKYLRWFQPGPTHRQYRRHQRQLFSLMYYRSSARQMVNRLTAALNKNALLS
jgi:hypothetical protein